MDVAWFSIPVGLEIETASLRNILLLVFQYSPRALQWHLVFLLQPFANIFNISMAVKRTMLARTVEQLRSALPTFTDNDYHLWFQKRLMAVLPGIHATILQDIPNTMSCSSYKSLWVMLTLPEAVPRCLRFKPFSKRTIQCSGSTAKGGEQGAMVTEKGQKTVTPTPLTHLSCMSWQVTLFGFYLLYLLAHLLLIQVLVTLKHFLGPRHLGDLNLYSLCLR